MSDYKDSYSKGVLEAKDAANGIQELYENIERGKARAELYGKDWEKVDLNEVVERIAPDSEPVREGGKLYFYNSERTMAVVADIGGGYLRVQDLTRNTKHAQYLDQYGHDAHNYTDENGKQHGRSNAEFNRCTHYKIKKREEM